MLEKVQEPGNTTLFPLMLEWMLLTSQFTCVGGDSDQCFGRSCVPVEEKGDLLLEVAESL